MIKKITYSFLVALVVVCQITAQNVTVTNDGKNSLNATTIDASGNIVNVGSYYSTVDFDPSSTVLNITPSKENKIQGYVQKLSSAGALSWVKVFTTNDKDATDNTTSFCNVHAVTTDALGNVYVSGAFAGELILQAGTNQLEEVKLDSDLDTNTDAFVAKLTANGEVVWAKKYNDHEPATNGYKKQHADALVIANNKLIVAGDYVGYVNFNTHPSDTNNNIKIQSSSNGTYSDIVLIAYDLNGTYLWNKNIPASNNSGFKNRIFNSITATANSIAVLSNTSNNTIMTVTKFDLQSNTSFEKNFYADQYSNFYPLAIKFDSNEHIFINGRFKNTVSFDPDDKTLQKIKSHNSYSDIFLLKLKSQGTFDWVKTIQNTTVVYTPVVTGLLIVNDIPTIYGTLRQGNTTYDLDSGEAQGNDIVKSSGLFLVKYNGQTGAYQKSGFLKYVPLQSATFGLSGSSINFYNGNYIISGYTFSGSLAFYDKTISMAQYETKSFVSSFSESFLSGVLSVKNEVIKNLQLFVSNRKVEATLPNIKMRVFDINGRQVKNENLKNGVYIVKALNKQQQQYIKKVLVY